MSFKMVLNMAGMEKEDKLLTMRVLEWFNNLS